MPVKGHRTLRDTDIKPLPRNWGNPRNPKVVKPYQIYYAIDKLPICNIAIVTHVVVICYPRPRIINILKLEGGEEGCFCEGPGRSQELWPARRESLFTAHEL